MKRSILTAALLGSALLRPLSGMTEQERREYGQKLLQILPDAPSFRQWLEKYHLTGS